MGSVYLHHFIYNEIESSLLSTHTEHSEQYLLENKPLAIELDIRGIEPDIQTHQPVQYEENPVEFPQPQSDELSKAFIHQGQTKPVAKSPNKISVVSKETAVAP